MHLRFFFKGIIIMRRFLAIALSSTVLLQAAPLMAAPGKGGVRDQAVRARAYTGAITGTAQSAAGGALANCTIQVRDLQTGRLAATSTSDAAGSFAFTNLPPAKYVVEVRDAGAIVGSHATRAVVAGGTVDTTVSATVHKTASSAASTGSTATAVTTAAAAAGIAALAGDDRPIASPSR
jgi:hypothetical protein